MEYIKNLDEPCPICGHTPRLHCDPYYYGSNGQVSCLKRKISTMEEDLVDTVNRYEFELQGMKSNERSLMKTITRQGTKICDLGTRNRQLEDKVNAAMGVIASLSESLEKMTSPVYIIDPYDPIPPNKPEWVGKEKPTSWWKLGYWGK